MDAIQVVSGDQNRSAVFVYQARMAITTTVVPRGLSASTMYNVTSSDFGWWHVDSGSHLMTAGWNLSMPEVSSDILLISAM